MADYAINRQAEYEYSILETYEAGLALKGFEVKAVRNGRLNLRGAFAVPHGMEIYLTNASIPPYQPGNTPEGYDPERSRKLLLHKKEISTLIGKISQTGLTLIPLRAYSKNHRIKVLLGVAKKKKTKDKRETIRARDAEREVRREHTS